MKIISWNIDSINAALTSDSNRAKMSREVLATILKEDPDIIAIQETKLPKNGPSKKHKEIMADMFCDYDYVFVSSEEPARKGYAGNMAFYKKGLEPVVTFPKIDAPDTMDFEGRIITLEFEDFFLTQVYTPNAGGELKRLPLRQIWDEKYGEYLSSLDEIKPVIATGDFNVAHKEIDLANPESNRMSAGFTDEERRGFTNLLSRGFTDTFRHIHGDVEGVYTWWAQRVRTSKINNSGWRIDYFIVSDRIKDNVTESNMVDSGERQDHTPILLEINFEKWENKMKSKFLEENGIINLISGMEYSLSYAKEGDKVRDYVEDMLERMKIAPDEIYSCIQTHTDKIAYCDGGNGKDFVYGRNFPDTDGLVTDKKNLVLLLKFADCTPLVLYDKKKEVLSIVHSGWRGAKKKIPAKAIEKMKRDFGSDLKDIIAYIGPSIDIENYEVGEEVYEEFKDFKNRNNFFEKIKGTWHLSMTEVNKEILLESGINESKIDICKESTYKNLDLHSARREGKAYGLNSIIVMMR